ncbi:MAG: hypothetical protein POH28_07940 [Acidocella sp.]|nr:hypothetical protein [Acidocella sp.]
MIKFAKQAAIPASSLANMVFQSTMLAIEAQQVIALRLTKMALGGPDIQQEAELMVSEKLETLAESGGMMMQAAISGAHDFAAPKILALYRRKVRANRRRLAA